MGIHDFGWQWQYGPQTDGPWTNLNTTRHHVYTILNAPTSPWLRHPDDSIIKDNSNFVWTALLDLACRWAKDAHTVDDAAAAITQSVYDLGKVMVNGQPRLKYGEAGYTSFADKYSYDLSSNEVHIDYFDCQKFLAFVNDESASGQIVDCFDCASIVATFANAIGSDLQEVTLRAKKGNVIETNPIAVIGTTAFAARRGEDVFHVHSVAWEGPLTSEGKVFDACLAINGGPNASLAPFAPVLAKGMTFGTAAKKDSYIYHFAAQPNNVEPSQPVRRMVSLPSMAKH